MADHRFDDVAVGSAPCPKCKNSTEAHMERGGVQITETFSIGHNCDTPQIPGPIGWHARFNGLSWMDR